MELEPLGSRRVSSRCRVTHSSTYGQTSNRDDRAARMVSSKLKSTQA